MRPIPSRPAQALPRNNAQPRQRSVGVASRRRLGRRLGWPPVRVGARNLTLARS